MHCRFRDPGQRGCSICWVGAAQFHGRSIAWRPLRCHLGVSRPISEGGTGHGAKPQTRGSGHAGDTSALPDRSQSHRNRKCPRCRHFGLHFVPRVDSKSGRSVPGFHTNASYAPARALRRSISESSASSRVEGAPALPCRRAWRRGRWTSRARRCLTARLDRECSARDGVPGQ